MRHDGIPNHDDYEKEPETEAVEPHDRAMTTRLCLESSSDHIFVFRISHAEGKLAATATCCRIRLRLVLGL